MNTRTIINKAIILSVYVIAGFLLARSYYYGSIMGIICALIGIVAWTIFLYKLSTAAADQETAEDVQKFTEI